MTMFTVYFVMLAVIAVVLVAYTSSDLVARWIYGKQVPSDILIIESILTLLALVCVALLRFTVLK